MTLAGIGDVIDEIRDPLYLVSNAYDKMYGFVPKQYRRHNFSLLVGRSFKTGHIEKVIKNGKTYLRLTSIGRKHIQREFPIVSLTKQWSKKWIIVIFDIKEVSRKQRNTLRNMLKNVGFGMLQQSVWITPLPIGEDMKGFITYRGFSDSAFVLEVSHVLLGDPKDLASRVWDLDQLEEDYLDINEEKDRLINSIETLDGRHDKRYREIEEKIRDQKKKLLEFLVRLPPLPRDLFPQHLRKAIII